MVQGRMRIGIGLCGTTTLLARASAAGPGAAAGPAASTQALAWVALMLVTVALGLLALRWRNRALHERIRELEQLVAEGTQAIARREEDLARMAYFDPLTGLPNQRMFREQLRRMIAGRRRGQGGFTLLLIELDRFREVQAARGAEAGDALLAAVAERLRGLLRANDVAARLDGSEFALLLAQTTQAEAIDAACARIVARLGEPVVVCGQPEDLGANVGVVPCPSADASADELWRAADGALSEARQAGPSTWRWGNAESYTFTA